MTFTKLILTLTQMNSSYIINETWGSWLRKIKIIILVIHKRPSNIFSFLIKLLLIPPIYTLTTIHWAFNPVKIVRNVCVNTRLIKFCSAQSSASDPWQACFISLTHKQTSRITLPVQSKKKMKQLWASADSSH